jgi:monoamine oxidase
MGTLDAAVIGAGAAGAYAAYRLKSERPDWSVVLFERTARVGGRLWSIRLGDVEHPIELGGMRFMTSHVRVNRLAAELGLTLHPFDPNGGRERSYLRGVFAAGASDPTAGSGYQLADEERGRSAAELVSHAFNELVPGAANIREKDWPQVRRTATLRGKSLGDWPIGEALSTVLGTEAVRFASDAFGYDSGIRAFNAGDAIPYLIGGGDPSAYAVTPDAGMDSVPRELVRRFVLAGGEFRASQELRAIRATRGSTTLDFGESDQVVARQVVLALAQPALSLVLKNSPSLEHGSFRIVVDAVEAFPAFKLYLAFDRPWWRPETDATRLTTDMPSRKIFYRDTRPDAPAALLAAYTDGRDTRPWAELADGMRTASPAPARIVDAAAKTLRVVHPTVRNIPVETTSAFMHWGSDAHETGWTMWRPGITSDDVIEIAAQPDSDLPIFICGEAYSHEPGWVEGALESADSAVDRLIRAGQGSTAT